MPDENALTEIEQALKQGLEDPANVSLGGRAIPVQVVTPDPDLVELVLPVTTLQLVDVRLGFDRMENEFEVEKNLVEGLATVRWPEQPYDLFYTVRGHTEASRDDRLLLGQYLRFIDAHPILVGASGRRFYLARSLAFRDRSTEREFERALTFTVKARMPVGVEKLVPLTREHRLEVEAIGGA
jgi:hypothetical protein